MFFLAVLMFSSCFGQESNEEKLFHSKLKSIISSQTEKEIVIDIAEITDFDWDELFIFRPYTSGNKINESLGIQWSDEANTSVVGSESYSLFIFMNKGKVVLETFVPRSISKDFGFLEQIKFSRNDAKFISDKDNYVINHIKL
ncbi:MAG: hypothetical protein KDB74_12760 [Flavobacteriales bacterium]|nr:hypothetical protein [Flavobacteriales bacterium]